AIVVQSSDPISLAFDRLGESQHRGLVVVDRGWPVGLFAQREALAAKDAPSGSPVDAFMSPSIVCVPPDYPAHRVAARAAAVRPRAVFVTDGPEVVALVTALDFARLVAEG
ncbi:MAG TPA: CBS domain-containing protein, partial [Sandaracinaceae bacterium]